MNMVEQVTDYVKNYDEEVGKAIELELGRQRRNLELIASENIISPAVMMAMATVPANKYAEGYPGKRYYGGCENVDIVENLASETLKELFGCDHACVQPHSGANANNAVYQALIKPGDTVMGLNLAHGGHLTHGSPGNPIRYLCRYCKRSWRLSLRRYGTYRRTGCSRTSPESGSIRRCSYNDNAQDTERTKRRSDHV